MFKDVQEHLPALPAVSYEQVGAARTLGVIATRWKDPGPGRVGPATVRL